MPVTNATNPSNAHTPVPRGMPRTVGPGSATVDVEAVEADAEAKDADATSRATASDPTKKMVLTTL